MVRRKEKADNQRIKKADDSVPVLAANTVGVLASDTFILLDFGFVSPSYYGSHDYEDSHVARVCIDWERLEALSDTIKELLTTHKAPAKKRKIK